MRKVILGVAVSLDGFIEGPNGEYDWCFTDQDYGLSDFFKRVDAMFIGRKSYELMNKIGADAVPGMPQLTEYVFSNSLSRLKDGAVLINGDIASKVQDIINQPGKDIWLFGGSSLVTSLMNLGFVHEVWLSVHPIVLGNGKPLFNNIESRIDLQLIHSKTYDTGLVSLTYMCSGSNTNKETE